MIKTKSYTIVLSLIIFLFVSCTTVYRTSPDNAPGRATIYEDPSKSGRVQGIGLESQDIISMTDKMMRDMFTNQILSSNAVPPRVIIDAEYFRNESSQRMNKSMLADRLRVGLNRASNGRMVFIARHAIEMVEREKELKNQGVVDKGTKPISSTTAGADFRLIGSIKDLSQIDPKSGMKSKYFQVIFEMVGLDKGIIAWSGIYEFKKSARDDIIYRF